MLRLLPRSILMTLVLSTSFIAASCTKITTQNEPQNLSSKMQIIRIGNTTITAEVARTEAEHELGLSYRESLASDHGMLFVFTKKTTPQFWMKDMRFDLDFIWITNNTVVDITERVIKPQPNTPDEELTRYSPTTPVDAVLEVNSNFIQQHHIRVGDVVQY